MSDWTIEKARSMYRINRWGSGYFDINDQGNCCVLPNPKKPEIQIDIQSVVKEIKEAGIQFPVSVRFYDILHAQVIRLNEAFKEAIEQEEYQGRYLGVYPIKVNQSCEVVEEIVEAGAPYQFGLEAGSKAELMAILVYNTNKDSLAVLNGYKDDDCLRLALLGRKLGQNTIVVIEKFSELIALVRLSQELNVKPLIGLRAKMHSKGKGRWVGSGGYDAKFGLTAAELINAVEYLKKHNLLTELCLLHFHIGSQLTDIRSIKEAVNEGAWLYAELYKLGAHVQYIDIGGGLGIDYDGSASTENSSCNYSLKEYAANIVYHIKQICVLEKLPHPDIVTESGRAVSAHHSLIITEVMGEIRSWGVPFETKPMDQEHRLVIQMRETMSLFEHDHRLQEIFADAAEIKGEAVEAFKLGVLNLQAMATIETLYWEVIQRIQHLSQQENMDESQTISDDLKSISNDLSSRYLCNFSVFQSTADIWAINQVLPVMPLMRLNEKPTVNASLVDITCDSDGKIENFSVQNKVSNTLPLHELKEDEPYYIGLFLTGAYQDVMGDMHNLFGRLNEVHIYSHDDDDEKFYIQQVIHGSSINNVLSSMQYNPISMSNAIRKLIDQRIASGLIRPREGIKWAEFYAQSLNCYTYCDPDTQSQVSNILRTIKSTHSIKDAQ